MKHLFVSLIQFNVGSSRRSACNVLILVGELIDMFDARPPL